ncbi:MAG: hypothetical protein M3Y54_21815, partial [Bacteroidota bacterium]|nr:hypothetical protein [Bacteroidota bacterium]
MQTYFLEDDNLEYITGDVHFGKLFDLRKDKLLKKCTFIPIASLLIDYKAMKSDTSRSFNELLKPHYQIYSTFLLKHGKLVTLLRSASTIPPDADKITLASFLEDKETTMLYDAYKEPAICIFYEPALRTYAYLKGERLFYYEW